jgi:hypothetical protein
MSAGSFSSSSSYKNSAPVLSYTFSCPIWMIFKISMPFTSSFESRKSQQWLCLNIENSSLNSPRLTNYLLEGLQFHRLEGYVRNCPSKSHNIWARPWAISWPIITLAYSFRANWWIFRSRMLTRLVRCVCELICQRRSRGCIIYMWDRKWALEAASWAAEPAHILPRISISSQINCVP